MEAALTFPTYCMPSSRPTSATDSADGDDIDVALMRKIAEGDERAFRELVERHQNAVVGTVARMLNDSTEAEDIAQLAFLRIWKHAKRWRPDAKFTTYLFTITRNLVFNESRRRTRRKEVSSEEREEESGFQVASESRHEPQEEAMKVEMHQQIDRAIATLPEAQRTAVILYSYESLPYEEIATVLNTSVSSVKSLLFRARTTLREKLANYMAE
ncbi:sigma-70 family RNA polymerase sigma factor [Haloferula sp. BvORR071]|uniref:RNA polymerase sigma factor n=1 Tax=Haloferula sp. BvORR071 TaxID=1396141 RepID=UPI002240FBDB|nr:sigma-70 family RNA polymerase sigma factor [Haloferula sp. BvORR071]